MKGRDKGWLDMERNGKYNCENTVEVKLNFEIENTNKNVLLLIKNFLGGNIIYRKSKDTYYYETANYGSAKNVINYLDQYNLISSKHVDYLKWRKAYILIQKKDPLTESGLTKIIMLKTTMNRNNSEEIE